MSPLCPIIFKEIGALNQADGILSRVEALEINLKKQVSFDRMLLQENISNGQSIKSGKVEYWDGNKWQTLSSFSTVGYKRLLRFQQVSSNKIRITINGSLYTDMIQLSDIGIYKASPGE